MWRCLFYNIRHCIGFSLYNNRHCTSIYSFCKSRKFNGYSFCHIRQCSSYFVCDISGCNIRQWGVNPGPVCDLHWGHPVCGFYWGPPVLGLYWCPPVCGVDGCCVWHCGALKETPFFFSLWSRAFWRQQIETTNNIPSPQAPWRPQLSSPVLRAPP